MPKPSLVSLQQHHRAAGERNFLHEHHSQETSPSPDPPGEDGGWIQSAVQVEWRSSQQPGDSTVVRWSAHRDAEPHVGLGQVVAGLRRRRVKKHQLLKPRVWHCVHLAAGWWGWCGWVCVFCLVLFLLAMCHFGGGETFNNALSRSSRSVFHSSEPHCTAALSPVPEPFPSRRVRPPNGSRDPRGGGGATRRCCSSEAGRGRAGPGVQAGCPRVEPHAGPHIQISGRFLFWDFQFRELVMHDEPSDAEIATEPASPLRTLG